MGYLSAPERVSDITGGGEMGQTVGGIGGRRFRNCPRYHFVNSWAGVRGELGEAGRGRRRLQAAASDDLTSIVWVGDLGELTSVQLVGIMLEQLTVYYLKHKRQ